MDWDKVKVSNLYQCFTSKNLNHQIMEKSDYSFK